MTVTYAHVGDVSLGHGYLDLFAKTNIYIYILRRSQQGGGSAGQACVFNISLFSPLLTHMLICVEQHIIRKLLSRAIQ